MNTTNATSERLRLTPVGRPNLQRVPLGDLPVTVTGAE